MFIILSNLYTEDYPYFGYLCQLADIPEAKIYQNEQEAEADCKKLNDLAEEMLLHEYFSVKQK